MRTVACPCVGTDSTWGVGVRSTTRCDRPSPETRVSCTGMLTGEVIVGGFSEPPGRIVYVAGSRASVGGAPPVAGAPGFVVVSGAVGGVPVAVRGAVRVIGGAAWVVVAGVVRVVAGVVPVVAGVVPVVAGVVPVVAGVVPVVAEVVEAP